MIISAIFMDIKVHSKVQMLKSLFMSLKSSLQNLAVESNFKGSYHLFQDR